MFSKKSTLEIDLSGIGFTTTTNFDQKGGSPNYENSKRSAKRSIDLLGKLINRKVSTAEKSSKKSYIYKKKKTGGNNSQEGCDGKLLSFSSRGMRRNSMAESKTRLKTYNTKKSIRRSFIKQSRASNTSGQLRQSASFFNTKKMRFRPNFASVVEPTDRKTKRLKKTSDRQMASKPTPKRKRFFDAGRRTSYFDSKSEFTKSQRNFNFCLKRDQPQKRPHCNSLLLINNNIDPREPRTGADPKFFGHRKTENLSSLKHSGGLRSFKLKLEAPLKTDLSSRNRSRMTGRRLETSAPEIKNIENPLDYITSVMTRAYQQHDDDPGSNERRNIRRLRIKQSKRLDIKEAKFMNMKDIKLRPRDAKKTLELNRSQTRSKRSTSRGYMGQIDPRSVSKTKNKNRPGATTKNPSSALAKLDRNRQGSRDVSLGKKSNCSTSSTMFGDLKKQFNLRQSKALKKKNMNNSTFCSTYVRKLRKIVKFIPKKFSLSNSLLMN